jgi:uncharacterized protein
MTNLVLSLLPERLAICRLPSDILLPEWAWGGAFFSITGTDEETSIVCEEDRVPDPIPLPCQRGRRALKVQGPLDFSLTGILAGLAGVLAQAGVSIFAISTYDTDYILVAEADLANAVAVLRSSGYTVHTESQDSLSF